MLVLTEPTQQRLAAGAAAARTTAPSALHLDRVAERGAGAVRLDVADVGGLRRRPAAAPARITRSCAGPFGAVQPAARGRPG